MYRQDRRYIVFENWRLVHWDYDIVPQVNEDKRRNKNDNFRLESHHCTCSRLFTLNWVFLEKINFIMLALENIHEYKLMENVIRQCAFVVKVTVSRASMCTSIYSSGLNLYQVH